MQKDVLFLKLYSEFLNNILIELYRILKPSGQFYLNLKHSTINKKLKTCHWVEFLDGFSRFYLKSYIIWKYAGSFDSSFKRFHLDYEVIYHLAKSDDFEINIGENERDPLTSVWYIPHNIKERIHPVQMPEQVAERIIKRGSKKNDLVLDPFAGSGTSLVVAKKCNRNYIGIEINPLHHKNILNRLNGILS